jgi:RNA polymerase sigma factor (sigma-70 family)
MDESDLLRQAIGGCESSLALLMHEYTHRLKDYAARFLAGSPPDVTESDVVQETQIRVMKRFRAGEFRGTTMEEFRAYIFTAVRNLSINWRRVNRREYNLLECQPEATLEAYRRLVTVPPMDQSSPSETASRREEEEFVQKAIESLRPIHQQIYRLSLQAGITNEEIGRQVGLSAEAVRKTRMRMLVLLNRWIRKRLQMPPAVDGSSS